MSVEACWSISLDCECPHCAKDVNLLEYADFGDTRRVEVGEHDTDNSRDLRVVCPECYEEFEVDLVY